MRIVEESEHTLVLEETGNISLYGAAGAILLHALIFVPMVGRMFLEGYGLAAGLLILVSLLLYWLLLHLARRFRDRITVTFDSNRSMVCIRRVLLDRIPRLEEIPFTAFRAFVVSAPAQQGWFGLEWKDGRVRRLLRVRTPEEYETVRRIGLITRKETREDTGAGTR